MTPEQIQKMINDGIAAGLKPMAEKLGKLEAQTAKPQMRSKREQTINTTLKGVPEIYRQQLPDTDDDKELSRAAYAIIQQVNADALAAGITRMPDIRRASSDGGMRPSQFAEQQRQLGGGDNAQVRLSRGLEKAGTPEVIKEHSIMYVSKDHIQQGSK